mmetsp:Transcript_5818/g.13649  ORF Transcript_5818/g.13649 Transcript_5818/m.13649 type:complete len:96 (+) Transcript_5818:1468-1755(+)
MCSVRIGVSDVSASWRLTLMSACLTRKWEFIAVFGENQDDHPDGGSVDNPTDCGMPMRMPCAVCVLFVGRIASCKRDCQFSLLHSTDHDQLLPPS